MRLAILLLLVCSFCFLSAQQTPTADSQGAKIKTNTDKGGGIHRPHSLTATPYQDSTKAIVLNWQIDYSEPNTPFVQFLFRKNGTLGFDTVQFVFGMTSFIDSSVQANITYTYMVHFADGIFNNVVSNSNQDTASIKNSITVGIKEDMSKDKFLIYPNPTKNSVSVRGISNKDHLQIFDMLGKELHPQVFQVNQLTKIDLSSLNDGIYFLKVNNGIHKIIKQ